VTLTSGNTRTNTATRPRWTCQASPHRTKSEKAPAEREQAGEGAASRADEQAKAFQETLAEYRKLIERVKALSADD
jgi:hypothetical protein